MSVICIVLFTHVFIKTRKIILTHRPLAVAVGLRRSRDRPGILDRHLRIAPCVPSVHTIFHFKKTFPSRRGGMKKKKKKTDGARMVDSDVRKGGRIQMCTDRWSKTELESTERESMNTRCYVHTVYGRTKQPCHGMDKNRTYTSFNL